ncbi:MAG: CHASE2 domain-containing protein [Cyanobacteriota bacterium]|nr:CHASE2 domain-containing protein [Cyanobacteriota bacterium]
MSTSSSLTHYYSLKVQKIDRICVFELSWGQGQQLTAQLEYPLVLAQLYEDWRRIYLSFYKSALRGRVGGAGSMASQPIDWHAKVVQAEATLMYEFHTWLRSEKLFKIRAQIAQTKANLASNNKPQTESRIEVFLTCTPLEIGRLPWENWEIATEFDSRSSIRISRTPANISIARNDRKTDRTKTRVLMIIGEDKNLNFEEEIEAVAALEKQLYVESVGWQQDPQENQTLDGLKGTIREAITDSEGWDILLFAGHSNEQQLLGGQIAIAPNTFISIQELASDLAIAQQRGLQFALFNSCNGLNIAEALIDLGLSQVAIMREAVHNRVAQEFLVQFLQHLAQYKDVHDCLLAACNTLKLKQNLTYPSAYLIPSLFRHPGAELFRLHPRGWKTILRQLLPSRIEAVALAGLVLLSLQIPVQFSLQQQRLLVQAAYRDLTGQEEGNGEATAEPPPILLVQIDEESILRGNIVQTKPMDRAYFTRLIDRLVDLNARVIGLDYLQHRSQGEKDQPIAQSIQRAISDAPPTWFVFAKIPHDVKGWLGINPKLARPEWSLSGDIYIWFWHLRMLDDRQIEGDMPLPFPHALALADRLHRESDAPQPQLERSSDLLKDATAYLQETADADRSILSPMFRRQPLTTFSYRLHQQWLHPILDFSVPPERVYQRLPAWQLLDESVDVPQFESDRPPIVIVAPGGYGEAGIIQEGGDNFALPPAIAYWRDREAPPDPREKLTGAEAHAYALHHLLEQRVVVPIPDFWGVVVAVLLGKGMAWRWQQKQRKVRKTRGKFNAIFDPRLPLVLGIPAVYGLISLQVYVGAGLLFPWVLPSVAFWGFTLPPIVRRRSDV